MGLVRSAGLPKSSKVVLRAGQPFLSQIQVLRAKFAKDQTQTLAIIMCSSPQETSLERSTRHQPLGLMGLHNKLSPDGLTMACMNLASPQEVSLVQTTYRGSFAPKLKNDINLYTRTVTVLNHTTAGKDTQAAQIAIHTTATVIIATHTTAILIVAVAVVTEDAPLAGEHAGERATIHATAIVITTGTHTVATVIIKS